MANPTTSVKIQKDVHMQMQKRIISDGYGMRGKTKWINESIERFLTIPNYTVFVDLADEPAELEEPVSLRLTPELKDKLEAACIETRIKYPLMDGVKSKLIRASIMQRLIRG